MQNIIADINEWLSRNVDLYAPIGQNTFLYEDSTEEIMSRQEPSEANETRYMDESRSSNADITYFAKSNDQQKAERQLFDIVKVLDTQEIEIHDGCIEGIDIITMPTFSDKTTNNQYIFTCTIRVSYNIK